MSTKLRAYLKGRKENMADFAARLTVPCSQAQVSRLCAGQCVPSRELMIAIYVATKGDVAPNDWFDLPDIVRERAETIRVFVRWGQFAEAAEIQTAA